MSAQKAHFLGPTLHPIRKWIIGFAFLGICVLLLAAGLFRGFPLWLQMAGWAFLGVLYCVSDFAWYPNGSGRNKRQIHIHSRVVPRWLDDQPCERRKE
jgi:hypothetical protein